MERVKWELRTCYTDTGKRENDIACRDGLKSKGCFGMFLNCILDSPKLSCENFFKLILENAPMQKRFPQLSLQIKETFQH